MRYVYGWYDVKEDGVKEPFYIGIGKINNKSRYRRAHECHQYGTGKKTIAQLHLDKVKQVNPNNVSIEIIFDNLSRLEALRIEFELVNQCGRRNNNTGVLYNLVDGGIGNPMNDPVIKEKWLHIVRSEEHRNKQRIKYYENITADTTLVERRRQSLITRHLDPDFKKNTPTVRDHMNILNFRENLIGEQRSLLEGVEYSSIREASRLTGFDRKTISSKKIKEREVDVDYRNSTKVEYLGNTYGSIRGLSKSTSICRSRLSKMILTGEVILL